MSDLKPLSLRDLRQDREARAFVAERIDHFSERLALSLSVGTVLWCGIAVVVVEGAFPVRPPLFFGSVLAFTLFALLMLYLKLVRRRSIALPVAFVIAIGAQAAVCLSLQFLEVSAGSLWIKGTVIIVTSVLLGISVPIKALPLILIFPSHALFIYHAIPEGPEGGDWAKWLVLAGIVFFCALAKVMQVWLMGRMALMEQYAQHAIKHLERVKHEQEIELARRIQDSLGESTLSLRHGRVEIRGHRIEHGVVGGDWMAIRPVEGGVALALFDAAGKGLQAAMVIHAVQSLWARSLAEPAFDPGSWLAELNRTMLLLGQRELHALTAGICVLRGDVLTYWSAAHLPLYVAGPSGDPQDVRILFGKGSMIGVSEEFEIVPVTVDFRDPGVSHVLLATDGVYRKGGRLVRREVVELIDVVSSGGGEGLRKWRVDDDVSLVWLRAA